MRNIDKIYIDGQFVTPKGTETGDLHNPSTEEKIGTVRLAGVEDAQEAIAAAKRAFPAFSRTSKAERIDMLKRLNAAVAAHVTDLTEAMSLEYGAPQTFTRFAIPHAASSFLTMASVLEDYEFERQMGRARVVMQPSGVAAAITPWNSNIGFITSKLATAIAAGSSIVIKPSEMSAIQTQILTECLHEAGLPKGVFNIINGYGNVVDIRHSGNYTSRYAHFSRFAANLRRGQSVNAGDIIGYVGQTGHATGPHLHFEFLHGTTKINFLALKTQ